MDLKILKNKRKRTMMLLEVMIAFALVALCVLPLLSTNLGILKEQKGFERKVILDHAVNLFYGDILERLYLNKISWNDLFIQQFPIDDLMVTRSGVDPKKYLYRGSYRFTKIRNKPELPGDYSAWLFKLIFTFYPLSGKGSAQNYEYEIFIVRDLKEGFA